jgi:hypothetical protein
MASALSSKSGSVPLTWCGSGALHKTDKNTHSRTMTSLIYGSVSLCIIRTMVHGALSPSPKLTTLGARGQRITTTKGVSGFLWVFE